MKHQPQRDDETGSAGSAVPRAFYPDSWLILSHAVPMLFGEKCRFITSGAQTFWASVGAKAMGALDSMTTNSGSATMRLRTKPASSGTPSRMPAHTADTAL